MWLRIAKLPEETNALLLSLGRALAIAQNYEHNARYVLRIAQMSKEYVEGRAETLDELIAFANSRPRRMLGGMVRDFDHLGDTTADEIEILRRGAEARNFIAHEAFAELPWNRPHDRLASLQKLDAAVRHLVEADNLVACWSYEIHEKAHAPAKLRSSYPREAHRWVMAPLGPPPAEPETDL
jgi:hypothetical protein